MSVINRNSAAMRWHSKLGGAIGLMMLIGAMLPGAFAQESGQKTYATPENAGKALYHAAKDANKGALLSIFGASSANLISSADEVQDKNVRDTFTERFEQMNRWGKESDGSMILYVGAENWPFPIPLKKDAVGQWFFDTKTGQQEILFRRIGENELAAIRVCDALANAQHEYFGQTHDGDSVHQYAQKFASDEGKQNGLYWKLAEGQPESPVGPLVAYATGEGYGVDHASAQPFHGYFFRILSAQGANVKDGAKSYIVDGKMTKGFAILAYPAEYRNSGVMTFILNQDGVIHQKDLGADTFDLAKQTKEYNPDASWTAVAADTEAVTDLYQ
jgi:hypothetical protein